MDITPEMIEAGVQELAGYDEFSDRREVVERILRSALQSWNRCPEPPEVPSGYLGDIPVYKHDTALD